MSAKHIRSLPDNGGTNAWFGVSIFLGILLVVSLLTNVFVILNAGPSAPSAPGAPSAPSAPGAPSAPSKVEVSADDDPVLGDKDAPVTIIEFSDYQCPYCKRFHDQTWAQLKANYIDTGKVKFVYRDFPLSFHQNAQIAAEAAECADDQGKYWEYHEILFTKGSGDGTGLDSASLKQYAADLKLDTSKFNTCLDSGKYRSEVQKDMADGGAAGVQGTPSFFVNGQALVGAQPYAAFEQLINAALAE